MRTIEIQKVELGSRAGGGHSWLSGQKPELTLSLPPSTSLITPPPPRLSSSSAECWKHKGKHVGGEILSSVSGSEQTVK